MKIFLRRRDALMVAHCVFSHKMNMLQFFRKFYIPILLNGWILPIGGASSGRVCACSLCSRLVTLDCDVKFLLHTLYNRHCTPCTIHTARLEHYTEHTCTIHTACLAQYTLHILYNYVLLVGCLNSNPIQILRVNISFPDFRRETRGS